MLAAWDEGGVGVFVFPIRHQLTLSGTDGEEAPIHEQNFCFAYGVFEKGTIAGFAFEMSNSMGTVDCNCR